MPLTATEHLLCSGGMCGGGMRQRGFITTGSTGQGEGLQMRNRQGRGGREGQMEDWEHLVSLWPEPG